MSVFVLDKRKRPLMPCSEKRARLLLSTCRAVVHRLIPFTIRLKERTRQESAVQPTVLKVDPGSQTTGMALARMEATDSGQVHHALHLAELIHRGEEVRERLRKRAGYRRRRRGANLRYRAPRWSNRRRKPGWLPPSLQSRIGNVLTWARRYQRWIPISRIEVERVKFDIALLQQPELTGVEYQRGELFGWEVRSYLLEKFGRRCAYCRISHVPFEIDHQVPRSRGGSNRVSNLVLSCHSCNLAKGNRTAAEWGHPEVEGQARAPFQGAAAVNATRYALVEALLTLGVPIGTWSGGRTRWNRDRFGYEESALLGCAVRRRASRRSCTCSAYTGYHRARTREVSAHQCGCVWLSTRLLHQSQADTRLRNGRSGTRRGARAFESRRGSPGAGGSPRIRLVSGREDGRDQRQVLSSCCNGLTATTMHTIERKEGGASSQTSRSVLPRCKKVKKYVWQRVGISAGASREGAISSITGVGASTKCQAQRKYVAGSCSSLSRSTASSATSVDEGESGRFSVKDVVTGKLLVDGVDHRKLVRLARATHGLIVQETLVQ